MPRAEQIQALFDEAVTLPPEAWKGFLFASPRSPDVVSEVETLLAHHLAATEILEESAITAFPAIVRSIGCDVAEFRIRRQLGRGGMSTVFLAEDTILRRDVALKIISPELARSPEAVDRFRREARAAARLEHPGIVPIYRFGEDRGAHFLAMQFVAGETLEARLNNARAADPTCGLTSATSTVTVPEALKHSRKSAIRNKDYVRECCQVVCGVARALDFAHGAGVLHRDVKPSNILLDTSGMPHLADFGIAKADFLDVTSVTQEAIGTWRYMSPEQAAADKVDRRTDVFSLGVVLYELLTLEHPFPGTSPAQVLDALRCEDPRPVRALNPTVPRDLETICHKALEKQRHDRYSTAAHLAADLECQLRGDPILARPPGVARRATRWMRRHRVGSLVAVAAVLVGSLGAGAGIRYQRSVQALAHVSIDTGSLGTRADVYLRAWDHDRRILEPATLLGAAPVADHAIPAGQYRFVVVAERGAFAEFDATLAAGQRFTRTVAPTAAVTAGSEMVSFETGAFTVRVVNPDGTQQDEQIVLDGFMLDITEVSNAQYKEFVDATKYRMPEHWLTFGYDAELSARPVVNISFDDAQSYCSWVGKRLPTAAEWEAAARAPDGRSYPWGDFEDAPDATEPGYEALVNAQSRDISVQYPEYRVRTRSVDSDAGVQTANGLRNLSGNVMELTGSPDPRNPNGIVGMGGSWLNHPKFSDLRWTFRYPREAGSLMIGFRCARGSSAQEAVGKE